MENFSCNNAGQRGSPNPNIFSPVAANGIKVTCTSHSVNYTTTVEAGASYRVVLQRAASPHVGVAAFLSTVGTSVTAANREWVVNLGESLIIHIPNDKTTLNMSGILSSIIVYLVKLQK